MLFGESTFAEVAFSSSPRDANVTVSVIRNQLNITIGSVGIIADSIVENVDPNRLTLGLGTLSITGDANFDVTGSQVALGLGNFVVTADANINATGNTLTLATGNVTITGTALVNPNGSALSLDTVEPGIITWNDIIPGATMVWTPIKPY
jgi:hypothetical protein